MPTTSPPDDLEARVNSVLLNLTLREAVAAREVADLPKMRAKLEEARKLLLDLKSSVQWLETSSHELLEQTKSFRFEELEPEWSDVFGNR